LYPEPRFLQIKVLSSSYYISINLLFFYL